MQCGLACVFYFFNVDKLVAIFSIPSFFSEDAVQAISTNICIKAPQKMLELEDDIGNSAGKRECAVSIHISINVQHSRKSGRRSL